MKTRPTIDEIAAAIDAAMPELDSTDRQIATAIYRLMSTGQPVEPATVAKATNASMERLDERLDSWPGVYRDAQGRVVGFWGHAISKLDPPVSLVVDDAGAHEVTPAGTLLSMVARDSPFDYNVIESFCHRVLFFASEASGSAWIAEHEGTTLLVVDEAFELGRRLTERLAADSFAGKSTQDRQ